MDRPLSVILLGSYCFFLTVFFAFWGINGFINHRDVFSTVDFGLWLLVLGPLVMMVVFLGVGIGVFCLSNIAWKALFFVLLFCIATFVSMILVALILLLINTFSNYNFLSFLNMPPLIWFSLLFYFLSQIIVCYYLSRKEVRIHFGEI